ncbi:hypothetical protein NQZ68_022403 [Dissostichus eleginoides]|nr:hypothetical protein NQZ68_022403 [Dissostichus eleginoides]
MKDGQLQFLGYMLATQETPEPGLGVKMDGDANINKNCTLTVEGLSENSSALYFCAASQHSAAGSSLSDNVQQTPAYMYKNLGEEAVISCSHSIENYDRILWYKQMKDGELQFLGYILKGFKNPEPGLGVKMDGDANINKNCTLTVEGLSENSSALYFCAASQHSAAATQAGTPEPGLGLRIGGRAHAGHNCTLTIEGLSESSSAEFFCAVSLGHTAACHCSSVQKPPQHKLPLSLCTWNNPLRTVVVLREMGDYYGGKRVCLGVEVRQTPAELLMSPGDKVQLVCSHEKNDYTFMQWYQQPPGERALKRIGHLNFGSKEYEEPFKKHFKMSGDLSGDKAKNASLFIDTLKAEEHSAVYFCAASYAH